MTPEEFYILNKDKIYKTAEFVANRRGVGVESIVESIKEEYKNANGSSHEEIVWVGNSSINLSNYLNSFRKLEFERLMVFLVLNGEMMEIYHSDGDQFSSFFTDNEIIKAITDVKKKLCALKHIYLYMCHNHPFTYKAFPSEQDLQSYQGLKNTIRLMNSIDGFTIVEFVDYGIVTNFDYWSLEQQYKSIQDK